MANCKNVIIRGLLPFNCCNHPQVQPYLAAMNGPSFGFKIEYGGKVYEKVPETNGEMTLYKFLVTGTEGVGTGWIKGFLQSIVNCGGKVEAVSIHDIDAPEVFKVEIPEAQNIWKTPLRGFFYEKHEYVNEIGEVSQNADLSGKVTQKITRELW